MKNDLTPTVDEKTSGVAMPDIASLAALRAWYEGMSARECAKHYLGHAKAD